MISRYRSPALSGVLAIISSTSRRVSRGSSIPFGHTASYVNDRNIAWNYDSAGNIKDDTMSHTYDVLSRQTNAHDLTTNIDQSYDGDSRPAKRAENRSGFISSLYYVRSSVLGGQVVSELNTTGQNAGTHKTHIYVNGSEIALYDSWINVVIGRLSNPVTGSGWQETDPLGGYVGFVDPFPANPDTDYASLHPGEALFFQDANPFDSGSGCTQDEMPTDCNWQARQLENGTVGVRVGLGRNIYAINNYQRGLGGYWRSMPTPSEPGGPTEPERCG